MLPDIMQEYRNKKALSTTDLAMLMHVSRDMIEKIEAGDLLPDIDFLTRLSEVLVIPLAELLPEDAAMPLPFNFGKPKNLVPVVAILFFPAFITFWALLSPFEEAVVSVCMALLIFGVTESIGFFDIRRYYTYFSVTDKSFVIFDGNPWRKATNIIRTIFKRRKVKEIPFSEIKNAKIWFDTSGFKGSSSVLAYRPRQSFRVREQFLCKLTLEDETEVTLDLSQAFYKESKEREHFCSLFHLLCHQGIAVEDPSRVLYSFQNGENFVAEAYNRDTNEGHKRNKFYQ